ncbi:MAG TPA: hypothetical protein DFR83_17740 [Deltaproteobacteria bacterium]|nr:hypothetical protein [Deltaproteobacteria bacterium]
MARWGDVHAGVNPTQLRSVRRVFDGHERMLFEALLGQPPMPSSQAWPLSIAVHQALGWLSRDPRAPLLLATVVGSLTAVFVAMAVRRHARPEAQLRAGLSAGLLVACLPEHMAWSTSATPVVHGLMCLTAAFATRAWPLRTVFAALAAAFRPELAIPALFLGRAGGAALGVALLQILIVGGPPGAALWPVLRVNLLLVVFIGPASLGFAFLAVHNRATAALAVLAVVVHLLGACFSDYGARHALPAAVALCALAALDARKPWLPVLLGVGFVPSLLDTHSRWHHRAEHPPMVLEEVGLGDCLEISDEPPVPGQPRPSWVALAAGEVSAPCVSWGEAPEHTEWSSRGLRDRALRMKLVWQLASQETHDPGAGRPWRRTWRLVDGPGLHGTIHTALESPAP